MSVTTRPSARTKAERIQTNVDLGVNREIPGLTEALDAHEAIAEQIRASPYIESEKRKRIAAAETELHTKVGAAIDAARRSAGRDLDQREGHIRASLSTASPEARTAADMRAFTLSTQIAAVPLRDLDGVFAEAELSGDDVVIRATGYAMLKRLSESAAADKGKPISAARDLHARFQQKFDQWQRQHPTASQRLEVIELERQHVAMAIQQSAEFALRLYGVTRPSPGPTLKPVPDVESKDRVKVGPAFDLLDPRARR
jgi:hypothetical protein